MSEDKSNELQVVDSEVVVDESAELNSGIRNVVAPNKFSEALDDAKIGALNDAQNSNEEFVKDFKSKLIDAASASAELEEAKAKLEKQHIDYHSEILKTKQLQNEQKQDADEWDNRRRKRQFHYDGVKPIMEFVGIKLPMNLITLYFLTIIIIPFFIINKLLKATLGVLIAGAQDDDRSKMAKGVLWTTVCVLFIILIAFLVILLLKLNGIDILYKLRSV